MFFIVNSNNTSLLGNIINKTYMHSYDSTRKIVLKKLPCIINKIYE